MDDKLRSGEKISLVLLKAIEESAISIIVLSKNYASFPWCLDELMKILECRETRGQQILPLFYQMKLQRWKTAVSQVANLSGRLLGNNYF
jgi:hypothetical protein